LGDANLIENLRKLDIPPDSLSFELLESIYLDDQTEMVSQNLAEIRKLGIGIEIDDFGTGHASIACLLSLRPMRLKIDRVLVSPIVVSVEARRLLESIVDIGQALGIEVLAEGVETLEHARILADLDCRALQGFALALPMAADKIAGFVQKKSQKKVA
jgi:EAL domain-containing protein (putative c-di-GMP-specific phosphodiesterase class I)